MMEHPVPRSIRATLGAFVLSLAWAGPAAPAPPSESGFELQRRLARAVAEAQRVAAAADAGQAAIEGLPLAQRSRRALAFLQDATRRLGETGSGERRPDLERLARRLRAAAGQEEPARRLAPAGTGRISGRVTAAASGASLPDVGINVYNACGTFVAYGYSDASGNYVSDALLDTGTYFAEAIPFNTPGYLEQAYAGYNLRPPDYSFLERYTTPIAVTSGATTTGIDFALMSSAAIHGQVRQAVTATPVNGAEVYVYDQRGRFVRAGRSDEEGAYAVTGLAHGSYLVEVGWNADQLSPRSRPVRLDVGPEAGRLDFDLPAGGGRISGTVASGGRPVAGVPIGVYDTSGSLVTREYADASGRWSTGPGLPAGAYFLRAELRPGTQEAFVGALYGGQACATEECHVTSGTPIRVGLGQRIDGIALDLIDGGTITGTVREAAMGSLLQGVRVAVVSTEGLQVAQALTDESGRYAVHGLPRGAYRLLAEPSAGRLMPQPYGAPPSGASPRDGAVVQVAEGSVTSAIDFSLGVGGVLTGVATTNLGRPLSMNDIRIFDATGQFAAFSVAASSCPHWQTHAGLPAGTYYACYQESSVLRPRYRSQLFSGLDRGEAGTAGDCQPTTGSAISLGDGGTVANIDFTGVVPARRKLTVFSSSRAALGVFHEASGLWFLRDVAVESLVVPYGGPGYVPVAADYKGSGVPQIAVYHPASGLWFIRDEVVGTTTSVGFGGSGYQPIPSDYDGDGKTDLAVFHAASGLWFIRPSTGGSAVTVDFGAGGGFTPVPEDYDGDGRSDLALYHAASGLWYIRRSSTGSVDVLGFGGSDYAPVPGDYDADGRMDVAVYHKTLGLWFLRLSATGATQAVDFGGGPGYTPVPADWDEDSETDLALYHEASGAWYLRRSLAGAYAIAHGGPGYIPVY